MTDHVRHFAGDVLCMMFFLYAFLVEKAAPQGRIPADNVDCFCNLFKIICTYRRGRMTEEICNSLTNMTVDHNTQFLKLYGHEHAKPKFGHSYDVPRDNKELDEKVFSCFTTERKNKDCLALAESTDKNIRKTTTVRFLNESVQHLQGAQNCEVHYQVDCRVQNSINHRVTQRPKQKKKMYAESQK